MSMGFTLIELLLYVAIFTLVVSIAMGVVFGVLASAEKQASIEETQEAALLARSRISNLMRSANAAVRTGPPAQRSAFDVNPGRLSLTLSDGSSAIFDTYTKGVTLGGRTFSVRKLRLTLGVTPHDLTSDAVNVTAFMVRDRTQGSEPDNIKIEFAVERLNPDGSVLYQASDSFHSAVSRRKN